MGLKVYVAGPYTKGDKEQNVRNAIDAADVISRLGLIPYIPHLSHYWDLRRNHPYEFWMNQCLHWLLSCDIVFRIHGESPGADLEVEMAKKNNMPVFYDIFELAEFVHHLKESE